MSQETPADDPRQKTEVVCSNRPASPGKDRRRRNRNQAITRRISKSGRKPYALV
jgi:hypothetical protein